jgi:hypothetical protein
MVLNDFGPLGRAYIETDEAEADEATIVDSVGNIRIRLGWAPSILSKAGRVTSQRIAQAVLNKAQNEYRPMSIVAQEFLGSLPIGLRKQRFAPDASAGAMPQPHSYLCGVTPAMTIDACVISHSSA